MKTPLRYLPLLLFACLSFKKTLAQCSVSNILIQNIVPVGTQTSGSCNAKFDLSFAMETNNGNKFIFLHGWAETTYPDFFQCVNGVPSSHGTIQAPNHTDLAASFLNLGIDNTGPTPSLLSTYPPDASVTFNTADSVTVSVLPDGTSFFIIHGVTATLP